MPPNLTFQVSGPVGQSQSTLGATGTSTNPSGGTQGTLNQTTTESVNTATGNTYLSFKDIVRPGNDLHFQFIRSYNNQDSYSGPLCRGWTHTYNILLSQDSAGAVTIKQGDGHQDTYQPGSVPGTYVAPAGVYDVLTQPGTNTWSLVRPDQTVFRFGPDPLDPAVIRLLSIADRNGNTESLSYDSNGNLTGFNDIDGDVYAFTYDVSNHLTSLQQNAGGVTRTFGYACDGSGNLVTYQDANGQTSHYSYSSANLLSTVTDPLSNTAVTNAFDSQGRVISVTRRLNNAVSYVTTYFYDDTNHVTTITGPRGEITRHYYDAASPAHLIKIVNALVSAS